jgi:excisionase family DNA binding protein
MSAERIPIATRNGVALAAAEPGDAPNLPSTGPGRPRQEIAVEVLEVDLKTAAKMLNLGESTLHRMTRAGKVPHVRHGRTVRYRVEALKAWLASIEQGGPAGGGVSG